MPSVEERLAYLEGRVGEHARSMNGLVEGFGRLADRMDGLDRTIDRFREELAGRFDAVEQKLTGRIDGVDGKVDRVREELSAKMSSHVPWLVGIQVSILVAVVGALVAG